MDRAEYQVIQLLFGLVLGGSLGLFFDLYRVWLSQVKGKRKKSLRAVGDLLWWVFALGWTFFWLLMLNWAEIRFLILFMICLGLLFYIFCLSRIFLPIFTKLYIGVLKVLRLIWQIVLQALWYIFTPIVWLSSFVYLFTKTIFTCLQRVFGFFGRKLNQVWGIGKKARRRSKSPGKGWLQKRFFGRRKKKQSDSGDDFEEDEF